MEFSEFVSENSIHFIPVRSISKGHRMPTLSLLLRVLSIAAAAVVVVFYIIGGNRMKDTQLKLQEQISVTQHQQKIIEEKESLLQENKSLLDNTIMELATFKRDKRLNESEVVIAKQELQKSREQLEELQNAKLALIDENEQLRRETIELRAQGYDPNTNPKLLTAQIENQRTRIFELEAQLNDAQTVLTNLFNSSKTQENGSLTSDSEIRKTRIQRFIPEHNILVLEVGSSDGIIENAEFGISKGGIPVAKVKAARVTPDLCVVNILSSDESGHRVFEPGQQIEYKL